MPELQPLNLGVVQTDVVDEFESEGRLKRVFGRFVHPRGDESTDDLGIPNRVHYWVLAIFASVVALLPLLFSLTPGGEELRNAATRAVCIAGILSAPTYVLVAKRFGYPHKDWAFQMLLLFAVGGPFLSEQFTPAMVPSFLALYVLGPVGASLYLPLRKALPIIAAGATAILVMSVQVDEPDGLLRGVILAIITAAAALMLSGVKKRLVQVVVSNREISERDPLTGTYNMRKFEDRLADEIARSQRGGEGFALVEFDLDNFKQVNDSHNHSVGDDVLVATADAIQSALDPADLLVRRGGDEFSVVVPDPASRDIPAVVELARSRISDAREKVCPGLTSTASAGWVSYDDHETAAEVLQRADHALHEAKEASPGRRDNSLTIRRSPISSGFFAVPAVAAAHEPTRSRLEPSTIGDDPIADAMQVAWRTGAAVTLICSAAFTAMCVGGATTFGFSLPVALLVATWAFVVTPLAAWLSTRKSMSVALTHVMAIAVIALITAGCLVVGEAAPALTDMYVVASLILMILLPFGSGSIYMAACLSLYGTFLYANDYPFADIRLSVTAVNIVLVGFVAALIRRQTITASQERALLARTDPLTGLPNTRRLRDRITDEIRRCNATGGQFALLMLDLDEFKSVNDTHSHSEGDKVLKAVAGTLQQTARHADMPARRGGDEFAVVMTDAGENAAAFAAERIADAIHRVRIQITPNINPHASVGWVVWQPGESVDDLVDRADSALHGSKVMSRQARIRSRSAG